MWYSTQDVSSGLQVAPNQALMADTATTVSETLGWHKTFAFQEITQLPIPFSLIFQPSLDFLNDIDIICHKAIDFCLHPSMGN